MKDFLAHARSYIIRGVLASIPLFLSLLIIEFLYVFIDKRVMNLIDRYVGHRIPGLGILLVIVVLYFIGLLASNVIGHRFFGLIEKIFARIPLLKTTYQIGKQVSSSFSLPEKQVFKQVVLVDMANVGIWMLGFVTGTLEDKTGEKFLKVFVPHVPNPTSGYVIVIKESRVKQTGWSVEEGMRVVISGGIIGPDQLK
jgi:uncharacterized membrane protein